MKISPEVEDHIRNHLKYPATKEAIQQACNEMRDVGEEDRAVVDKLPAKFYRNPDEVLRELEKATKAEAASEQKA